MVRTSAGGYDGRIEFDTVCSILGDSIRRRLLVALRNGAPEATFQPEALVGGHESRDRLEIELRHVHLPRLEEAGLIEWDRKTNAIARGPRFEVIEPFVELFEAHREDLPTEWP